MKRRKVEAIFGMTTLSYAAYSRGSAMGQGRPLLARGCYPPWALQTQGGEVRMKYEIGL